jgi:glutamate decarboxylase
MRIMCRRGFEMDFASLFMQDFKAALATLQARPALAGTATGGGFKHT